MGRCLFFRVARILPLSILCAAAMSCSGSKADGSSGSGAFRVQVSVPPHAYFVKRIGGDRVAVESLVKPGVDPHTYEPTPRQVTELGKARVYFKAGFPFEDTVLNKVLGIVDGFKVVDLREGVPLRRIDEEEGGEGEAPDHGHEDGADPHVWLSPRYALVQARTVRNTLVDLAPEHEREFDANFEAFEADIRKLDAELSRILAPLRGKAIFTYHPSYGYLADEYGFRQETVEHGGDEPTPKRLRELIETARREGVRTIFIEPEFSRKSAEAIATAIGGEVTILNPLDGDWLLGMKKLATAAARSVPAADKSL